MSFPRWTTSDAEFRFVLEPAPEAPSSYRIASFPTGNVLLVDGARPENQSRILAYPENVTDLERGHAAFELTLVERLEGVPVTAQEQNGGLPTVHQLPQLRRLDQELPASFPADHAPVLERQILPFFVVTDPCLARYRQVEESPYYTLEHRRRWDKTLDRQFDGRTERKTTETVVVGMTQLDASSFRSTFNWSVETTLDAKYSGPLWSGSASVTAKVGQEMETTRQQSTERSTNRTRSEEVTYPALGAPYRIVAWVPVDVYQLCRNDEPHPIQVWTVRTEGEDVTMFFSEKARAQSDKRTEKAAAKAAGHSRRSTAAARA
jgi:hypothetical protein